MNLYLVLLKDTFCKFLVFIQRFNFNQENSHLNQQVQPEGALKPEISSKFIRIDKINIGDFDVEEINICFSW